MAELSGNPIYRLVINDFAQAFSVLGGFYFAEPEERRRSRSYYQSLSKALQKRRSVEKVVRRAMEESAQVWQGLTRRMVGGAGG